MLRHASSSVAMNRAPAAPTDHSMRGRFDRYGELGLLYVDLNIALPDGERSNGRKRASSASGHEAGMAHGCRRAKCGRLSELETHVDAIGHGHAGKPDHRISAPRPPTYGKTWTGKIALASALFKQPRPRPEK
ncbi:hypothetical protein [Sphingopyxis granuli]|uniref:hypothetical protein n=1 Tax=Sphingopyxis granuli TaxID=267128 RepID=UPI001B300B59|nr:hypothetical protein [Sphingopyxis granuli]